MIATIALFVCALSRTPRTSIHVRIIRITSAEMLNTLPVRAPSTTAGLATIEGPLGWARAMGEFGPVLIFAGSTRQRTEVLPISIYIEFSIGHIESAVAISLLMIGVSLVVLLIVRVVLPSTPPPAPKPPSRGCPPS